jgi:S-adenosylmethionine-dependent methyltransferase
VSNLMPRWKRSITTLLKLAEECIKVALGLKSQNHTRSRKGLPKPPPIVALGYVAASPPAAEQLYCLALGDESRILQSSEYTYSLDLRPGSRERLDRGTTSPEGCMKKTANAESERFHKGANDYAAYLETPEGRLRSDLSFDNLQEFIPLQAKASLCALDLGCGTGATAVRLARLGIHVTLLDSSPAMLDIAQRAAREAGVTEKIALQHGDAEQLANLFGAAWFDVILCHNVLEYLDDPIAVLCAAARALRDSSAILSVLVRNRAGEVFKAAIQAGDLANAENNLTAEWGQESLYGGRVRLFTSESLQAMLRAASLAVIAERGVRVLADYLPSRISRSAEYEQILELERKLGSRPEYAAVARYTQCFARLP